MVSAFLGKVTMNSYDAVPYPSYAYSSTNPANSCTIARLFGVNACDIETANVLELACAGGGNIIPLAARFPNARFTGVDLSEVQIGQAKAMASRLELSNINFIAADLTEIDLDGETFDYIIAHGLYSWVPAEVQDAILDMCSRSLSPNGVAHVSYNTLPGWNMVQTVRDMMLYHTRRFDDPAQKVLEARRMLNFVSESASESKDGHYKKMLATEIDLLTTAGDEYLLHDHLEASHVPCYFHEFISNAGERGLQYLADADLPSMYLGNSSELAAETLAEIGDIIQLEQYLDFVNNRRFRRTLLVHESQKLKRNIEASDLEGYRLGLLLFPKRDETRQDGEIVEELDLVSLYNEKVSINVKGVELCTCFIEMARKHPIFMTVKEISELVAEKYPDITAEKAKKELNAFLVEMVFRGVITMSLDPGHYTATIEERPRVFDVARIQGEKDAKVANLFHEMALLGDDRRLVMQYVDGTRSIQEITQEVRKHIENGELNIRKDDEAIELAHPDFDSILNDYTLNHLAHFALNALLMKQDLS